MKTKKEVLKDEKRGEMSFNMDFKVYGKQVNLKVSEKEGLCLKTENLKVVIEQDKLRLNLNDGTALTMPWACDIKKAV